VIAARALRGACLLLATVLAATLARAEPYLAVQQGYKCSACHFNPTGGGMRSDFGSIYSATALPAHASASGPGWTGRIADFLRVGADWRGSSTRSGAPHSGTQSRTGIDQLRAYLALQLFHDRAALYVDESLAPGDARAMEAYVRLGDPALGWYLKAGQFYLPFGWRLQDQSSFVREVSGISMTTPGKGAEIGYERGAWTAQLDVVHGPPGNAGAFGRSILLHAGQVHDAWRAGLSLASVRSDAGDRHATGAWAGYRTGPVAWLGELDLVSDGGYPEGTRRLVAGIAEADWNMRRGHNLKVSAELFDPDREISHDQQARWSVVYECTPIARLQLRAGLRRNRGIPQNDFDNRHLVFIEAHAWL
jgi:hypothetical protein